MAKQESPGREPESESEYPPRIAESSTGSLLTCTRCGREFSAYQIPHYSLAWDGQRIKNQNRGRAASHLRACRRKWDQAKG